MSGEHTAARAAAKEAATIREAVTAGEAPAAREPATTGEAPAAQETTTPAASEGRADRMPAIYLSHGAPPLADDPLWTRQLAGWSATLPRPASVLMVSAHWESVPLAI